MNELSLVLHVFFVTVLVGPQVLLFLAVTPATWAIEDHDLRTLVVRVIARRYALLTLIALAALLVTGLYQLYNVTPVPIREEMMDYRYGTIFVLKMTVFLILIGLIAVHGMVFARRTARVAEAVQAGELERWELERARRNSMVFSGSMLLVTLVLLALGVLLGNPEYARQLN